jgi:hypothetical protein
VPAVVTEPSGAEVERVQRGELTFVINHGEADVTVSLAGTDLLTGRPSAGMVLGQFDVAVVQPTG